MSVSGARLVPVLFKACVLCDIVVLNESWEVLSFYRRQWKCMSVQTNPLNEGVSSIYALLRNGYETSTSPHLVNFPCPTAYLLPCLF